MSKSVWKGVLKVSDVFLAGVWGGEGVEGVMKGV